MLEALPYEQVSPDLKQLPAALGRTSSRGTPTRKTLMARILPPVHLRQASSGTKRMASASLNYRAGVVLDYQTVNGSVTNYTFQGDTTYYISSGLTLWGTNNVLEGGAVLKFATGAELTIPSALTTPNSLQTLTIDDCPIILTALDDDSVGSQISGSTGSPHGYYAYIALAFEYVSSPVVLRNLRISYARDGISSLGETPEFINVQLMSCGTGCSVLGGTVTFENSLFGNDTNDFIVGSHGTVEVTNATFSGSSSLAIGNNGNLYMANCIMANITNAPFSGYTGSSASGDYNGFYNSPAFGTNQKTNSDYPFETVGGGSYYLRNDCDFRGVGTTNIDSALLADLAQRTTYPPIVYDETNISSLGTLGPRAWRDTNSISVDIGYHYFPLAAR